MKQSKLYQLIKNFGYVISSNLLNLLVSSIVILILPKVIGVEEYGYWQLYTFYLTYIGFFHFGWCDGIYLKFGGKYYEELEKPYFASQISSFLFFQMFVSLVSLIGTFLFADSADTSFIFIALSLNFVVTNSRLLFIFTLQTTNKIKEASSITILDRLLYVLLLIGLLVFRNVSYQKMIIVDNIARLLSLVYSFYICRDLVFASTPKRMAIRESFDNIRVGSNLMLANIASSLIIGIVRFAIQRQWDITTFGKVSLTLSLSNLIMTFINAVGIVVFPMLKRMQESKLAIFYASLRAILMSAMFLSLILYYPLHFVLNIWLPAYRESLFFMGFVFPMIVFESKTSLLLNTYLKALRAEKLIFRINVMTTILSVLISLVTVVLFHNLNLAVFSIVLLLAFRSTVLELRVTKMLSLSIVKDLLVEMGMVAFFIGCNILLPLNLSFGLYTGLFILYLLYSRKTLANTVRTFKSL